jgi:hypothetical protein
VGALARGSTRLRAGASARGGLDDADEGDGLLRTTSSRVKESRALGESRADELLRSRASDEEEGARREKSSAPMR